MIIIVIVILLLFFFLRNLKSSFASIDTIAIVSMMYKPKNVESWLEIHRNLGISHFYIRLENTPT